MIDQREEEDFLFNSFVWVVGNLCNGFRFHGPYLTHEQAVRRRPKIQPFESGIIHSLMSPLHPDYESGMLDREPKGRPSHILLQGSPLAGFDLVGPFYSEADAWSWQGSNTWDGDAFVVEVK